VDSTDQETMLWRSCLSLQASEEEIDQPVLTPPPHLPFVCASMQTVVRSLHFLCRNKEKFWKFGGVSQMSLVLILGPVESSVSHTADIS
jgi:hypothetical protein